MKRFAPMKFCLSGDDAVVESPTFENAVDKVQNGQKKLLTSAQYRTGRHYLETIETPVEGETGRPSKRISLAKEFFS